MACGSLPPRLLGFVRSEGPESTLGLFHLGRAQQSVSSPSGSARELSGHGLIAGHLIGGRISLPAYGAYFASLEPDRPVGALSAGAKELR